MVTRPTLILLFAILLLGCRPATPTPEADPTNEATPPPVSAFVSPGVPTQTLPLAGITPEQVMNSMYELAASNNVRVVQLVDGAYTEGKPGEEGYLEVRVTDVAIGDLTADGINEAAAIVSEYYGGSGVFVFLAAYEEQKDQAVFNTSVFIDDRPKIEGLRIDNNEIRLIATVHRLDEAMCCPTLETVRHYRLDNQLDMSDYATLTPDGRPRTITIESPPDGMAVSGSIQVQGRVAVAPFENNLIYSVKDGGDVELSRGAVTVSADGLGGPGTFDVTIPMSDTLWPGAVITVEIQDVSPADGQLLGMDSVRLVVK